MANIKQQIKRNKQAENNRERNKAVKSKLKTDSRRFREAFEAGEKESAELALKTIYKDYDTAARKGIIHPNAAARKKSKLTKRLAGIGAVVQATEEKKAAKKKTAAAKTATKAAPKTAAKASAKTTKDAAAKSTAPKKAAAKTAAKTSSSKTKKTATTE